MKKACLRQVNATLRGAKEACLNGDPGADLLTGKVTAGTNANQRRR